MSPVALLGAAGAPAPGASFDRIVLLPSAVYNASQIVNLVNPGYQRLVWWLDATVNPGAATLQLNLESELPGAGGTLIPIVDSGVAVGFGGGPGQIAIHAGPGVTASWNLGFAVVVYEGLLPEYLIFRVLHDNANNWTYSSGIDAYLG